MERLCQPWDPARDVYGNLLMVGFLIVQCLDGIFTYVGIAIWGASIEANPIVSSAVAMAGPGAGLAAAKLIAASCGITLHLLRVHGVIAFLTVFYIGAAIIPWTALFFLASR